ncbi:MAG: helix-turn-helix transcriptional regulator [Pseudolabrys sp.]|nr:helix-turn-helix transcriptional regulator [Pseudolabrys sp.]
MRTESHPGAFAQHLAAAALQPKWHAPPVEYSVSIGLRHTAMILKLTVEPAAAATIAGHHHGLPEDLDADAASDPVLGRLISALGPTVEADDDENGAHLDAIRLALIVRWLGKRIRTAPLEDRRQVQPLQKWRMKLVESFIDRHLDKSIGLADLAKAAGLSPMYFAAQFRASTGLRPHDFLLKRRIERSKELLAHPNCRLVEVALDVGFQTQAHFTTVFKRFVGTTPARWRAVHRAAA